MDDKGALGPALLSDDDLMARAIEGDPEAFGDLYERHLDSIYRFVYFRLGDERDSEHLTETVFLKVWEALPGFQIGRSSVRGWLFKIAQNSLIDHYRTRKQEQSLSTLSELSDTRPDVEQQVVAKVEGERIASATSQLRPEHQQVLMLRFINDLSHAEVAEVLGRSEGAVRVLQHRALKALGELLEEAQQDLNG